MPSGSHFLPPSGSTQIAAPTASIAKLINAGPATSVVTTNESFVVSSQKQSSINTQARTTHSLGNSVIGNQVKSNLESQQPQRRSTSNDNWVMSKSPSSTLDPPSLKTRVKPKQLAEKKLKQNDSRSILSNRKSSRYSSMPVDTTNSKPETPFQLDEGIESAADIEIEPLSDITEEVAKSDIEPAQTTLPLSSDFEFTFESEPSELSNDFEVTKQDAHGTTLNPRVESIHSVERDSAVSQKSKVKAIPASSVIKRQTESNKLVRKSSDTAIDSTPMDFQFKSDIENPVNSPGKSGATLADPGPAEVQEPIIRMPAIPMMISPLKQDLPARHEQPSDDKIVLKAKASRPISRPPAKIVAPGRQPIASNRVARQQKEYYNIRPLPQTTNSRSSNYQFEPLPKLNLASPARHDTDSIDFDSPSAKPIPIPRTIQLPSGQRSPVPFQAPATPIQMKKVSSVKSVADIQTQVRVAPASTRPQLLRLKAVSETAPEDRGTVARINVQSPVITRNGVTTIKAQADSNLPN